MFIGLIPWVKSTRSHCDVVDWTLSAGLGGGGVLDLPVFRNWKKMAQGKYSQPQH